MPSLVSVLTPCYNGANYVDRLLTSVLSQDYPSVEMIVIDDGSTDRSREVVERRIPDFEAKGYTLRCLSQPNQGQSVAIDHALKLAKGCYLVWPDMDDFYADDSAISKMAAALDESDDSVGMVRGLPVYLDEKQLKPLYKLSYAEDGRSDLFEDCLYAQNGYWFAAGCYMAKMSVLDECIPNRDIYTSKNAGQNWQLMLPLLYGRTCITIREHLYYILVRAASHSRGQYKSFEQIRDKFSAYENTIIATLSRMSNLPEAEKQSYITSIRKKYLIEQLHNCFDFGRRKEAADIIQRLKREHRYDPFSMKVDYWCCPVPGYYRGRRLAARVLGKLGLK